MNSPRIVPLIAGAMIATSSITNVQAHAVTSPHGIAHVVLHAGYLGKTLNKGYSTIEQATVFCGYQDCPIGLRVMANVGTATCMDQWAIVGLVDGNSVDGGPLLESLPNTGKTETSMWQGTYTVGTGTHTVTFDVSLPCSANINQWSVRYVIAEP